MSKHRHNLAVVDDNEKSFPETAGSTRRNGDQTRIQDQKQAATYHCIGCNTTHKSEPWARIENEPVDGKACHDILKRAANYARMKWPGERLNDFRIRDHLPELLKLKRFWA